MKSFCLAAVVCIVVLTVPCFAQDVKKPLPKNAPRASSVVAQSSTRPALPKVLYFTWGMNDAHSAELDRAFEEVKMRFRGRVDFQRLLRYDKANAATVKKYQVPNRSAACVFTNSDGAPALAMGPDGKVSFDLGFSNKDELVRQVEDLLDNKLITDPNKFPPLNRRPFPFRNRSQKGGYSG